MIHHITRAAGILAAIFATAGPPAAAQDKSLTLAAPQMLEQNGFLKYVLPRFSLKTGVRIALVIRPELAALAEGEADLAIAASPALQVGATPRRGRPVFREAREGGTLYHLIQTAAGTPGDHAARFAEWLVSETGQRTIDAFRIDEAQIYTATVTVDTPQEAPVFAGDIAQGERLSLALCGRCHVINARNRLNGLGSTPSFRALRAIPDWADRFQAFYVRNPHPSFTVIADLTPPFDPKLPPPIVPLELTEADLRAILAFVSSIPPADLGAPVRYQ